MSVEMRAGINPAQGPTTPTNQKLEFHNLMRDFANMKPEDRIVVVNNRPSLQKSPTFCQQLNRFFVNLGDCLGLTNTHAQVAEAISRLFLAHEADMGANDLAGFVYAAKYVSSLSPEDADVKKYYHSLLAIQKRVNPFFRLPKGVLFRIITHIDEPWGKSFRVMRQFCTVTKDLLSPEFERECLHTLSALQKRVNPFLRLPKDILSKIITHIEGSWARNFQVMRLVCKGTKEFLPMEDYFRERNAILDIASGYGGYDQLRRRYASLIDYELQIGNLEQAAALFVAFNSHGKVGVFHIEPFMKELQKPERLPGLVKIFEKVGSQVTKFTFVHHHGANEAERLFIPQILPHCPNLKELLIDSEIFSDSPAEFSQTLRYCPDIESLFLRSHKAVELQTQALHGLLPNLTHFHHSSCDPEEKLDYISSFTKLQSLRVYGGLFGRHRIPCLNALTDLKRLELSAVTLVEADLSSIETLPPLHSLEIDSIHEPKILQALSLQKSLEKISLCIPSVLFKAFLQMLENLPRLQRLTFYSRDPLTPGNPAEIMKQFPLDNLAEILKRCQELRVLKTTFHIANTEAIAPFLELLCFYPKLEHLDVRVQSDELRNDLEKAHSELPQLANLKLDIWLT